MVNDLSPTVIIAVPGTQETKEMARTEVIEAIRRGEIPQDNWVWSPAHNDWKPVAELPDLNPPPPAPTQVFMNGKTLPAAASVPVVAIPAAIKIPASIAQTASEPKRMKATAPITPNAAAKTRYSKPMEVKHEFPIFKVLFFVIFVLVAGIVGANYFYVEQPFAQNLATTAYGSVPAYAHLGGFTQPGAVVIHVPPNSTLNADNLADFLAALAKSTPPQPFNSRPFDGVGLTSSWQSQYVFNGIDWDTLGRMKNVSPEERKKFILEHLQQIDGSPLVKVHRNEDPAALAAAEDKAWPILVNYFTTKQP